MGDFPEGEIRDKLLAIGVRDPNRYLSFQRQHGGRVVQHGVMKITWGIIHAKSFDMAPNEINPCTEVYADLPIIRCLDCDPQDAIYIDEAGALYDCCNAPLTESFELHFAQADFMNDYRFDVDAWSDETKHKITQSPGQILTELSDRYSQLMRWGDHIVTLREHRINGIYRPLKPRWKFW